MAIDNTGSPSRYTSTSEESAAAARRRAGLTTSTKSAVKKKTVSKTVSTPGTRVSQATIDKIKAMGMKKALAGAANASPEMREALKRMYGASRVSAAGVTKSKPAAKSPDQARGAMSTTSRSSSTGGYPRPVMPGKGPMINVSTPVKKSGTTDPFAKAVFGGIKAIRGGSNQGMTAAQVAAENKRRVAAVAAAKAKKNK